MNKAKAQFYRTLQSLTQAGLPLLRALAQPAPPKLRRAAEQLLQDLKGGTPLPKAMEQYSVFTPFEVSLVAVGAASGTLEQNFGSLAEWFENRHALHSQIISSLVHPAMTYFLAVPIICFINVMTKGMNVHGAIWRCIALWIAPFIAIWLYRIVSSFICRSGVICEIFDALPLIGGLRHKQDNAIFFQSLGLCLRGGIGTVTAIRLSADACRYQNNKRKFRRMADIIEKTGETFTNAFQQVMSGRDANSPAPVMLATGEATGTLDDYSLRLANLFHEEAKTTLTRLAAAAPVIVFVPLAIYIGYVVISFYSGYINGALDAIDGI